MKIVGTVVVTKLSKVQPNPWNPNHMDAREYASLLQGFQTEGWLESLLAWYADAPSILLPHDSFWVITARKDSPEVRSVTERWLAKRFGNRVLGLSMLDVSRTLPHVIDFKASVLHKIPAHVFVEDNLLVLRGLKRARVPQQLLYFDGSSTVSV